MLAGGRAGGGPWQKVVPGIRTVIATLVIEYTVVCGLSTFFLGPVSLFVSLVLVLILLLLGVETLDQKHPTSPLILFLWFVTAVLAVLVGGRNYHATFAPYFTAEKGRRYSDVSVAVATASEHADAGVLTFVNGTLVDDTMVVGLRLFGRTYCVAPITSGAVIEGQAGVPGPAVQFWAVGLNCCEKRGSFNCDDAGEANARGGVALHSQEDGEEAMTRAILAPRIYRSGYFEAIQAACALYEIRSAESPVLVRWVKDPDFVIHRWLAYSILVWLVSTMIYAGLGLLAWYLITHQLMRRRKQSRDSRLPPGVDLPDNPGSI